PLLVHRCDGGRRVGPRRAGTGVRGTRGVPRGPPHLLLAPAWRTSRCAPRARHVPARAPRPLRAAAPLQDAEPPRRRHRPLARAAALRHARPVSRAADVPSAHLLLRGPADRRRASRAEPGGLGVLLPKLRAGRPAPRVQPRRPPHVHADECGDRARVPPARGSRAGLRPGTTRPRSAARFTATTTVEASDRTGRHARPGSPAAPAMSPTSA